MIDASADSGTLWQSITPTTAPTPSGGLAPRPQARGEWTVVGQAPRQQTTMVGIYERLKLLSERETAWLFGHVHRNQRHLSQWQ
jgi:hypothetical protein